MSNYKPQSPLVMNGNGIFPLTTYDQIIMPDGSRWQGETSNGNYTETDPTVPAWAKEPNPPTYTKNDVGLGNVDNVKQYSADNPPPYPVTSVNGMTGAVDVELYPVGAVYISTSSTSPATIYGGTWEQIQDRFLLAAGSTYAAGSTGGEATHTLTKAELAQHDHTLRQEYPGGYDTFTQWMAYFKLYDSSKPAIIEPWEADFSTTGYPYNTGGIKTSEAVGQPHNNMPPYLTVYMWRRVA